MEVSVAGLGGGGFSRLGMGTGKTASEASALVRQALDLGINFFDTAESYRTEAAIGDALAGAPRDAYVLSTKKSTWKDGLPVSAADIETSLDASLEKLRTDHVDVYHLHGLGLGEYDRAVTEWIPALLRMKAEGKTRWIGVTEGFEKDRAHAMLRRAVADGWPDVVMVGYNILNPSARSLVLEPAKAKGIGTLIMFAVRHAFSKPERLKEILADISKSGKLGSGLDDGPDPLEFLTRDGVAASLPDAAYRFCRHTPGAHVTLFGTGSIEHLESNVRSLSAPPLPPAILARLASAFGAVDDVSGQ
jgi:aryl-alcohol dehydrogenase-like predicted oxidoreductase